MQDPVTAELGSDGRIWLSASLRRKEQCKMVPGARYSREHEAWSTRLSWPACKALRGIFGVDLVVGPLLTAWSIDEWNGRVCPSLQLRDLLDGPEPSTTSRSLHGGSTLLPFQRAGVEWAKVDDGCVIIADEMGTGKTIQVGMVVREAWAELDPGTTPYPMLVVCPNSVKKNWKRELDKWVGCSVAIASGSAKERRDAIESGADVVVIHFEGVWRHSRLAPYGSVKFAAGESVPKELNEVEWRTVVVDEAHRIKDPKSKQTRACWQVGHQQGGTRRIALTGTPVANAPDDLWAILHFIAPHEWPSRKDYVDRYCLQAWSPRGGLDVIGVHPLTREEFHAAVDPRMRRMPKELVLPFLPPKVRVTIDADMSAKQAKAYKAMEKEMLAPVDEGGYVVATDPMVRHLRLMQFSSSYAEVDEENMVKLTLPSNKVDALAALLDDMGDDPLVVFAHSRQLIMLAGQRMEKEGVSHRYIVGGMTVDQRDASIQDFQGGRARVILCTIDAASEGITLTRAGTVCFLQRSWKMVGNRQAEDRVHRIGSEEHDKILVIDVVAPGTVEEAQVEKLRMKFERLQEVVRDKERMRALAAAGDQAALEAMRQLEAEEMGLMTEDVA